MPDGSIFSKWRAMKYVCIDYYSNLYVEQPFAHVCELLIQYLFQHVSHTLSYVMYEDLGKEISIEELSSVLEDIANNVAPGLDDNFKHVLVIYSKWLPYHSARGLYSWYIYERCYQRAHHPSP